MTTEDQLKNFLGKSEKLGDKIENYSNFVTSLFKVESESKTLEGLKTGTLLDTLYLKSDNTPLGGIPLVAQIGIVGLSGTGKSLLIQETVLRVSNDGKKVVFVTSEDIGNVDNKRFDLGSRMKEKASSLNLDLEKIKKNVFVLDAVKFSELREWETFSSVYRSIVESSQEPIDLLVIDSITIMEAYRAALKGRILELSRFNQNHGITGIYVCQRSEEKTDQFSLAGGISVAHNLDSVICIDIGKAMGQLKEQLGVKQWDWVHFLRVLSCRICGFDRTYKPLEIIDGGFLRIKGKE